MIEEIDISELPGGALDFKSLEPTPEEIALTMESRRTFSDIISDLTARLSIVSQRL